MGFCFHHKSATLYIIFTILIKKKDCIVILFFIQIKKKVFLLWLDRGTLISFWRDTQEAVVAAEAVQPRHRGTASIEKSPEKSVWRA